MPKACYSCQLTKIRYSVPLNIKEKKTHMENKGQNIKSFLQEDMAAMK